MPMANHIKWHVVALRAVLHVKERQGPESPLQINHVFSEILKVHCNQHNQMDFAETNHIKPGNVNSHDFSQLLGQLWNQAKGSTILTCDADSCRFTCLHCIQRRFQRLLLHYREVMEVKAKSVHQNLSVIQGYPEGRIGEQDVQLRSSGPVKKMQLSSHLIYSMPNTRENQKKWPLYLGVQRSPHTSASFQPWEWSLNSQSPVLQFFFCKLWKWFVF